MARFRRNIAEPIQVALNARLKAMNTFGAKNALNHPVLDSHNIDWSEVDDYSLSREAVEGKSPFARMIGMGEGSIDVISGTFNQNITDKNAQKVLNAGKQRPATANLTGGPEAMYNLERGDDITLNRVGYTEPGITGITATNWNGGQNGGAVRQLEITWTCWSMEDLGTFQKNSFLSMGSYIVVDWGWVRSDKAHSTKYPPPNFIIVNDEGAPEIDPDMFHSGYSERGERLTHPWHTMSKDRYGDWDGVVGIVSNAQWTLRSDGGIDCTTTVFAESDSSLFEETIIQRNTPDDIIEAFKPYSTDSDTDGSFEQILTKFYELLGDKLKATDPDNEDTTELAESIKSRAMALGLINLQGPQLNLDARLDILDLEILYKYFPNVWNPSENKKNKPEWKSTDPQIEVSDDKSIIIMFHPYKVKDEDEFRSQAVIKDDKGNTVRNSQFRTDIWVTWGWFEDNVVSYYGLNGSATSQFRSIKLPANPGETVKSQEIRNDKHLYTYTQDFILPGQTPEAWFPDKIKNSSGDEKDNPWKKLAVAINKDFSPFRVPGVNTDQNPENDTGYLRNVLINLNAIRGAFAQPGITIPKGMLNLADVLNSGMELWTFQVDKYEAEEWNEDSTLSRAHRKARLMREAGLKVPPGLGDGTYENQIIPQTYYVYDTREKPDLVSEAETSDPNKSYVFENFGMYSIIQDLQITTEVSQYQQNQMRLAKQKDIGPLGQLLGKKTPPGSDEEQAYEVAQFFGSATAGENYRGFLASLFGQENMKNDATEGKHYGSVSPNEVVNPILTTEGLKEGSKWNHDIPPDVYQMAPRSRTNRMQNTLGRMSQYAEQGQQTIDIDSIKDEGLADTKEFSELNMYAFPPSDGPLKMADVTQDKLAGSLLPYAAGLEMNPRYYRTLSFYLSENSITSLLRASSNKNVSLLPIKATITLDGIGGLNIGDMFRLAYLPQDLYKQVRTKYNSEGKSEATDSDFTPATYFTTWGVEHTIDASGWKTVITGNMNANFKELTKDELITQTGIGNEQKLREAMEKSFKTVFKVDKKELKNQNKRKAQKARRKKDLTKTAPDRADGSDAVNRPGLATF
tara:strand:+ start:13592 stop:16834 length:3243 start_codon:yes stop_codon:yes gene_type:complete